MKPKFTWAELSILEVPFIYARKVESLELIRSSAQKLEMISMGRLFFSIDSVFPY